MKLTEKLMDEKEKYSKESSDIRYDNLIMQFDSRLS
jgi:hypothetical protein